MIDKNDILDEFNLRLFDESYQRIYKCLTLINEEQLWDSPNEKIPSIGNLILHLCGNARQWVLSGLRDLPDNRNRDDEFLPHRELKKENLILLMENLKGELLKQMPLLSGQVFQEKKIIQGFEVTGYSAISHVIEHFSYHTGQITLLAKLYSEKETDYYSESNLNVKN
ncbi:MAG: DUF1572 family protein [Fluviicola sp.]|nr:DUF1572 family protein [Fluviicola sp.]